MAETDTPQHNRTIRILIGLVIVVVIACAVTVAVVLLRKDSDEPQGTEAQTQQIIDEVGKLYILPAGETPTVARIQDKAKLQAGQTFYDKAQDGDYVLVFNKSRLAMLYRQGEGKLVFVSQVTTNNPADTEGNVPQPQGQR